MYKNHKLVLRGNAVIDSCIRIEQIKVARRYTALILNALFLEGIQKHQLVKIAYLFDRLIEAKIKQLKNNE